jgi:hypothetical protein
MGFATAWEKTALSYYGGMVISVDVHSMLSLHRRRGKQLTGVESVLGTFKANSEGASLT